MENTFKFAGCDNATERIKTLQTGEKVEIISNHGASLDFEFAAFTGCLSDLCSYVLFFGSPDYIVMRLNFKYGYMTLIENERLCKRIIKEYNIKNNKEVQKNMKKNTAAFVCGLIGSIFGLLGGILCSACTSLLAAAEDAANAISGASGNTTLPYLIVFIILGIGGSVLGLVGAIQAFGYKKAGFPLCLVGFLLQAGTLVAGFVGYGVAEFYVGIGTIVAVILLLVATVYSRRKQPNN